MQRAYPFYFYLMYKFLFISLLFFSCNLFSRDKINFSLGDMNVTTYTEINFANENINAKPSPVWYNFFKRKANRKKVIASILAFPIPGGILGLHRIYLGTKPYVPVIYILTLGGGLFILPIIDFCVLMFNKDVSRFENHPGIFMWIDNEKKPTEKENKTD